MQGRNRSFVELFIRHPRASDKEYHKTREQNT